MGLLSNGHTVSLPLETIRTGPACQKIWPARTVAFAVIYNEQAAALLPPVCGCPAAGWPIQCRPGDAKPEDRSLNRRQRAIIALAGLGLWMCGPAVADDLADYFGFGPMQIYKIRTGVRQLKLADIDGDAIPEILVWNAWKNRIEVFYDPARGHRHPSDPHDTRQRNEVPDVGPLRRFSVPVAYRLAHMEVADLTGDGRADIVFFGEPKELVVLPGNDAGSFGPPHAYRAPEGQPHAGCLAVGDFNHDGRNDVALLGDRRLLIYRQRDDGTLDVPQIVEHGIKDVLAVVRADPDGDGRDDLLLVADDATNALHVLMQNADGGLGAVRPVRIPKLRSLTLDPGRDGDALLCVDATTNRLIRYRWMQTPDRTTDQWPYWLYSYPVRSRAKQRPAAVGDLTGDGLDDVVVADPDAARVMLFVGSTAGLRPPVMFPAPQKLRDLMVCDFDGDGHNELLLVSVAEQMVGIARYRDDRLTFPEPLELDGTPLAAGVTRRDGVTRLAVLTRAAKGASKATLKVLRAPGLEPLTELEVGLPEDDPRALRFADVNQDGRDDLLLFVPFEPLAAFVQKADGRYQPLTGRNAHTNRVKQAPFSGAALIDVNADGKAELLLVQKNLIRALRVAGGGWTIVDQYNPPAADAQLAGLTPLEDPHSDRPLLVTFDRRTRELLAFGAEASGLYEVRRRIALGPFQPVLLSALNLGPDAGRSLVLVNDNQLALLRPDAKVATFREDQVYDTSLKDAWLQDCAVGDFNGDGVRDVALVDGRKANIEILTRLADGRLVPVLHFRVFEGKRFSQQPNGGGEPHEIHAADINHDGRDDIVILVHDRVIVYPGQ